MQMLYGHSKYRLKCPECQCYLRMIGKSRICSNSACSYQFIVKDDDVLGSDEQELVETNWSTQLCNNGESFDLFEAILRAVVNEFSQHNRIIERQDLLMGRSRKFTREKRVARFLDKTWSGETFESVGDRFNVNHAAIIRAVRVIDAMIRNPQRMVTRHRVARVIMGIQDYFSSIDEDFELPARIQAVLQKCQSKT